MQITTISDNSQVITTDAGKILAYVSNGVLYYGTKIIKMSKTLLNLKEFDTVEQAETYYGVTFVRPEADNE